MKVYVIQCKNEIMLNDLNSCKNNQYTSIWNTSTYDCECNKAWKSNEYLKTKSFSCKKRLIDKIELTCADKILNATEASRNDKKVTC